MTISIERTQVNRDKTAGKTYCSADIYYYGGPSLIGPNIVGKNGYIYLVGFYVYHRSY